MSSITRPCALITVAIGTTACADPERPAVEYVERDSAGVQIVESPAPTLAGTDGWTIDPAPVVEIGSVDGAEPYVFSRVWDATRFEDGRLAVVDELGLEIRLFDGTGQHLLTFGGGGEGPDEFRGPPFVRAVDDTTLLAWDGGHARLSWFSTEGRLVDQVTLLDALSELGVLAFPNGRVWEIDALGNLLSTGPVRPRRAEGLRESFRRIALFRERGTVSHDFGQVRAGQSFVVRLDRGSIGVGNPYAPWTMAGLTGEGSVAIGDDTRWEVRIHGSDGSLARVLRAAIPRLPVTPELEDAALARAQRLAETSPLTLGQAEDALRQIPLPDSVPAVGWIRSAGETLWVGRRTGSWWEGGDYDVFDARGRWLTTVATPPEIEFILEIGSDYLLAQVSDELEVQYLRMYRIETGGGR